MEFFEDIPILITGAEGFIGSHLTRRLAAEGAEVAALVLPGADLSRLTGLEDKVRVHPVDITDEAGVKELVEEARPEVVFHLAAFTDVGRSWEKLDQALSVNLGGTVNLIKALSEGKCRMMVATCTAETYGKNTPPFREEMALDPLSPYSFSKAAATRLCRMAPASLGVPTVILRLFLAYGPGQGEERFLPQLIRAGTDGRPFKMTEGKQTREYTYIDDVVEGFLLAAEKGKGEGEVYNLGSGEEIAVGRLVPLVGEILGREIALDPNLLPYRPNEIMRLIGDHSRIRKELGWKAKVGLREGLERTVEWAVGSGEWGARSEERGAGSEE